jgi:ubiquinone biosynthesis protein
MEVQPQLVLLQKTLLYIEGLGRQLYPQLDLWKTAKPFLENWVKEQMGVKAVLSKIKANLPFWNEKLPEMPDLVYDYLKQSRENQQHHNQLLQTLLANQAKNNQRLIKSIIIATLVITAAIVMS